MASGVKVRGAIRRNRKVFSDYQQIIPTSNYPDGIIVTLLSEGQQLGVARKFPSDVVKYLDRESNFDDRVPEVIDYLGKQKLDLDSSKKFDVNCQELSLADLVERLHDSAQELKGARKVKRKHDFVPQLVVLAGYGFGVAGGVLLHPAAFSAFALSFGVHTWLKRNPEAKELAEREAKYHDLGQKVRFIVLEEGKRNGAIPLNYGVPGYQRASEK